MRARECGEEQAISERAGIRPEKMVRREYCVLPVVCWKLLRHVLKVGFGGKLEEPGMWQHWLSSSRLLN